MPTEWNSYFSDEFGDDCGHYLHNLDSLLIYWNEFLTNTNKYPSQYNNKLCKIKKYEKPLDDNYNFPTKQHEKFHKWEMKKVDEFIMKLEKQFI